MFLNPIGFNGDALLNENGLLVDCMVSNSSPFLVTVCKTYIAYDRKLYRTSTLMTCRTIMKFPTVGRHANMIFKTILAFDGLAACTLNPFSLSVF